MQNNIVNIGYVTGLDYKDPLLDPHAEFQRYKTHPHIAKLLDGGKMIRYGAKTIAAGGYFAIPRTYADGVLLVGDCAGFLNSQRLKGIHSAIKTGMLAAETISHRCLQETSQQNNFRSTSSLLMTAGLFRNSRKLEISTLGSGMAAGWVW
jgi:electron-transferring-flavoprotein dehydrogenase